MQAWKQFVKRPGFSAIAVLTLALGIGANVAIFSFFNAVLLRAMPYRDAERLVVVWAKPPTGGLNAVSAADFLDWQKQTHTLEGIAAYHGASFTMADAREVGRVNGARVSANLFPILGIDPMLGRGFRPEEDRPGAPRVALLSHRLWQSHFAGALDVVGRNVELDGKPHTIIGVMPSGFKFLTRQEIWTPLAVEPNGADRDFHDLLVFARLHAGSDLAHAQAEMAGIAARLADAHRASNQGWSATVAPLQSFFVTAKDRVAGWILMGIVVSVLLIACVNVTNLLLARGVGRQHELAIRSALGASRWRIARQLLSESLLLGMVGGVGGVLLALWGIHLIKTRFTDMALDYIPNLATVDIDARVLVFTIGLSLLSALVSGVLPALHLSRPGVTEILRAGSRALSAGPGGGRTRSALVVAQFALAMVLLSVAGLFLRCIWQWKTTERGYRVERVLATELTLTDSEFQQRDAGASIFHQICERVQALPGVEAVGLTSGLPEGWNIGMQFDVATRPVANAAERPIAAYRSIDPGYFRTMGIRLELGREFTEHDMANGHEVAIISQMMARRFWPNENPIGQQILVERISSTTPKLSQSVAREIVGIARDVKYFSSDPTLSTEIYVPQSQNPVRGPVLVVRSAIDPASVSALIRKEILAAAPRMPVSNIYTMQEVLQSGLGGYRVFTELNSLFAGLAVLLAGIGIYGVMACTVAQRTREIAIRLALGATNKTVLGQVLRRGLVLALLGISLGFAGALAASRLVASLLVNLSPLDPIAFGTVTVGLVGVAALACYRPARRAAKVDPMVALRYE